MPAARPARRAGLGDALRAAIRRSSILRPEGGSSTDVRPMTPAQCRVIVEQNGRRESGDTGGGGRTGLARLIDPGTGKAAAREALRIALVNLEAVPRLPGVMDVVARPRLARHPAARGGRSRAGRRLQPQGDVGLRRAARPAGGGAGVTVRRRRHDPGPARLDHRRRRGHAIAENVLIEDGMLVGYMQDRQNARLMGVPPTGNGRRESYAHTPMPRMTNTFMLAGDARARGDRRRREGRHLRRGLRRRAGRHHGGSSSSPAPRPTGSGTARSKRR